MEDVGRRSGSGTKEGSKPQKEECGILGFAARAPSQLSPTTLSFAIFCSTNFSLLFHLVALLVIVLLGARGRPDQRSTDA